MSMTPSLFATIVLGGIFVILLGNRIIEYVQVSRRIQRIRKGNLSLASAMLLGYARMAHYSGDDMVATRYLDEIEKETK